MHYNDSKQIRSLMHYCVISRYHLMIIRHHCYHSICIHRYQHYHWYFFVIEQLPHVPKVDYPTTLPLLSNVPISYLVILQLTFRVPILTGGCQWIHVKKRIMKNILNKPRGLRNSMLTQTSLVYIEMTTQITVFWNNVKNKLLDFCEFRYSAVIFLFSQSSYQTNNS